MSAFFLLSLFACSGPGPVDPPPGTDVEDVVLNELVASNDLGRTDPDAAGCPEHDDWLELYNRGIDPVELEGWGLTDDPATPARYVFGPRALLPGEHLVLTADGEPEQGPWHLPFSLSADGEDLLLTRPDGAVVDRVTFPALPPDATYGRSGDGGATWATLPRPTPDAANATLVADACLTPPSGFQDHAFPCISTLEGYQSLSANRLGMRVVKFDILAFREAANRHMVFLDSAFYDLHDEWYLFRMFNGQTVEGEDLYAPYDGAFATIDDLYAWVRTIDLTTIFSDDVVRWAGARLTSPRYYSLAMASQPPVIGVGVLINVPARDEVADRPERWAFELEYGDNTTPEDIAVYFETLRAHLPPEIGEHLWWLLRSPQHEEIAQQMEAGGLPFADRILRYDQITVPGEVQVYNAGVTAGRVRVVSDGDAGPLVGDPDDLLVMAGVPDALPPGRALLTAAPQTPLAHVSLLAESRGIPNLFVDGIDQDAQWDQWGRVRAWVALRATAPDSLEARALSNSEVITWRRLQEQTVFEGAPIDLSDAPMTLDPAAFSIDEMASVRPLIGGKSAGFIALLSTPGVETPDHPLAVTVAPYALHMAAFPWLVDLLADPVFADPAEQRTRYLVLEGALAFSLRYDRPADAAWLAEFGQLHPEGDRLGDLARGRGLRGAVEDQAIPPDVLAAITAALHEHFDALAPEQGLRFRSSSNVEDIEGFNGAGLYASYTGWLAATDPADSVEHALQQTWASYWGAEAFEERLSGGISHTRGGMGVLVHPNFEDDAERANGVVTMTRLPDGDADRWQLVVNSQIGATSVTNPEQGADCHVILPEVVEVRQAEGGAPRITRVATSTETDGGAVLSDAALLDLFTDVQAVLQGWLDAENAALDPAQRRSVFTLDLELRDVVAGWPRMADGSVRPPRLVLKQSRPLEPGTSHLPAAVLDGPFPRDLAARAASVDLVTCAADAFVLTSAEVRSDPLTRPDMGHSADPFVASLVLAVAADVPALGWVAGDRYEVDHLQLDAATHPAGSGWALDAQIEALGGRLTLEDGGAWTFTGAAGAATGGVGACASEPLYSTREAWLTTLFP